VSKATFTFDMDDPEDRREHLRHTKSLSMAMALWQIQLEFKSKFKYSEKDDISLEDALEIVIENMSDHCIDLDELIE
jgi:hypothetical protein